MPFLHSLRQTRSEIGFSFHVARGGIGGAKGKVDAELKSSKPGTKSHAIDRVLFFFHVTTLKTATRPTSAPASSA